MANVQGPQLELQIALNGIDDVNAKLENLSQKINKLNNLDVEISFDSKIDAVKKSITKTVKDIQKTIAAINDEPIKFDMGDEEEFGKFKVRLGEIDTAMDSLSAKAKALADNMREITKDGKLLVAVGGTKSTDIKKTLSTNEYAKALSKLNAELERLHSVPPIELKFAPTNINAIIGTLEHAVTKLNLVRQALGTALDLSKIKIPVPKTNTINVNDDYYKRIGETIGSSIDKSIGKLDIAKQLNNTFSQVDFKSIANGINEALEKVYQQDKNNKLPIVPEIDNNAIKGLKTRLTNLINEIKKEAKSIPVELTLDITKFNERLKVARNTLDKFGSTKRFKPILNMDLDSFNKKLKTVKEALKKLSESKESTVKLKVAVDDASKAVDDFNRANDTTLKDKVIKVFLDYKDFDSGIKHVQEALASLKDTTVHINSNVKDVIAKEKVKEEQLKEEAKKKQQEKKQKPEPDSKENYRTILETLKAHPLSNGVNPEGNSTLGARLKSVEMLQSAIELGKSNPNDPNAFHVGFKDEGYLRAQHAWLEEAMHAVGANQTVSQARKAMKANLKDPKGYNALMGNLMAFPLSNGKDITTTAPVEERLRVIEKLLSVHEQGMKNPRSPRSWTASDEQLEFLQNDRIELIERKNALARGMAVDEYRDYARQQKVVAQNKRNPSLYDESLRQESSQSKIESDAIRRQMAEAAKLEQKLNDIVSQYKSSLLGTNPMAYKRYVQLGNVERDTMARLNELNGSGNNHTPVFGNSEDDYNLYATKFANSTLASQMADGRERTQAQRENSERREQERQARADERERARQDRLETAEATRATREQEQKDREQRRQQEAIDRARQNQNNRNVNLYDVGIEQDSNERRSASDAIRQQMLEIDKEAKKLQRIQQQYEDSLYDSNPMKLKKFMQLSRREDESIARLNELNGSGASYTPVFGGQKGYTEYADRFTSNNEQAILNQNNKNNSIFDEQMKVEASERKQQSDLIKEQMQAAAKLEDSLNKLQEALVNSRTDSRPMSESKFMANSQKEQHAIAELNRLNGTQRTAMYNGSNGYQQYLEEMRMAGKITTEEEKHNALVQRRKDIAHEYSQELQKQNQLLESGREVSQKEIDASERRIENIRRKWDNANWSDDETKPELRQSHLHGRDAQEINQQNSVKNAMAWQNQYFSTANSKVATLTASIERLYTELKRNPGDVGIKQYIEDVSKELKQAQKEAKEVQQNLEMHTGSITDGWKSKLEWIGGAFGFNESYDVAREFVEVITEIDEGMANLATVMPELHHSEKAMVKEQGLMIDTAARYGATINDVIESARLWGRMYKDEDSFGSANLLSEQSVKLAIADNFSLEESTKAVEAAMFQYGMVARSAAESLSYSNRITDVYTKLSHNAGVSAQDLAAGVERSGSVAHQAGMDFEFLTSLIAQGTRSTALSGLTNNSPFMLETA